MPHRGRIHQRAVCYHLYNWGINRDELFHDERDCDDEDDRWMKTQTGLAIGPPAFAQRFTESGGHLRPRCGPGQRRARNTTEVI